MPLASGGRSWYDLFDHTADLGVALHAADWAGLLEIAGIAFTELTTDREAVEEREEIAIALDALDETELLVSWFQELIYLFEVKRRVFRSYAVKEAGPTLVRAVARGEAYDPARHEPRHTVKAATYHALTIRKTEAGVEARIVLDT